MFKIKMLLMLTIIFIVNPIKIYAMEENTFLQMSKEECLELQRIAVAEAHGKDENTMAQIMLVILNRRQSDDFPDSIHGVVIEKNQFVTYPVLYNKYEPNETSMRAVAMLPFIENKQQLYFENTVKGSWISNNKQYIFKINDLYFYK